MFLFCVFGFLEISFPLFVYVSLQLMMWMQRDARSNGMEVGSQISPFFLALFLSLSLSIGPIASFPLFSRHLPRQIGVMLLLSGHLA